MTNNQTNLGGPGILAPTDHLAEGKGVAVTLYQEPSGGYQRGSVAQIMKASLATAIEAVQTNDFNGPDGLNANAGSVTDEDDAVAVVVNQSGAFLAGSSAKCVVTGRMLVRVYVESGTAYNEGQPVYLVDGEDYVTTNATLTGETIGRKCGILAESIAADARTAGAPSLMTVLFNGLPPYL